MDGYLDLIREALRRLLMRPLGVVGRQEVSGDELIRVLLDGAVDVHDLTSDDARDALAVLVRFQLARLRREAFSEPEESA